jgi:hypothetical protein
MCAIDPGMTCVAMHDSSGRRGLWYRIAGPDSSGQTQLEICAGREGDDVSVSIPSTDPCYGGLVDCFMSAEYAVDIRSSLSSGEVVSD